MKRCITRKFLPQDILGRNNEYFEFAIKEMIKQLREDQVKYYSCKDEKFIFGDAVFYQMMSRNFGFDNITFSSDGINEGTVYGIPFEVASMKFFDPYSIDLHYEAEEHSPFKKIYFEEVIYPNEFITDYCEADKKTLLNCKFGVDKMKIKKVIFSGPATIVFWTDGTKTVVKCMPGEEFDPEKGILVAFYKKHRERYGNSSNYFKDIKKWANTYNDILPEV